MTIKEQALKKIREKVQQQHELEVQNASGLSHRYHQILRWGYSLFHEFVHDDLTIRAESLSYFTLFSILPLIAGAFLMLSFFSQWAPLQDQFQDFLRNLFEPIPAENRETLISFILQFKTNYLAKINQESASIGIFAFLILGWIVVKVFINIEGLLNRIWSVSENRGIFARAQNFIVCAVVLPLIWIAALSLPAIVRHFIGGEAGILLRQGLPTVLMFLAMGFLFKFVPNAKVTWKCAFTGALFSSVTFLIANLFLSFYFKVGTNTAYGKAAALPLIAVFINVLWLILITGAEVSYIAQNKSRFTEGDQL